MTEILTSIYPWVKSLHVISVIAWMAGLFYLPRLFVYHVERGRNGVEPAQSLIMMEDKLFRVIMQPAMMASWTFGLLLVFTPGVIDWSMIWPWSKAASVIAMTLFHVWLGRQRPSLREGGGLSGRHYRMMNEVPTLLMVVIVVSVIVKF